MGKLEAKSKKMIQIKKETYKKRDDLEEYWKAHNWLERNFGTPNL